MDAWQLNLYDPYQSPIEKIIPSVVWVISLIGVLAAPPIVGVWDLQKYRHASSSLLRAGCPNVSSAVNNDMFGIGVRTATYIQASLLLPARFGFFKASIATKQVLTTANIWFAIAYTAAVSAMLRNDDTATLDLYVVIVLGNGLTMLMFDISLVSTSLEYETLATTLCKTIVFAMWKCCTTLFWWKRLPQSPAPQPGCENYGYMFVGKILSSGSALHIFHQVLNILGWVMWCLSTAPLLLTVAVIVGFVFWGKSFPEVLNDEQISATIKNRYRLRILLDILLVGPSHRLYGAKKTALFNYWYQVLRRGPTNAQKINGLLVEFVQSIYIDIPANPADPPQPANPHEPASPIEPANLPELPYPLQGVIFVEWFTEVALVLLMINSFLILPVEFIIAANRIPGVNDVFQAGQLLALVAIIGVCFSLGMGVLIGRLGLNVDEESAGGGNGSRGASSVAGSEGT